MVTAYGSALVRALSLLSAISLVLAHSRDDLASADSADAASSAQAHFANATAALNMSAPSSPQSYFAYSGHATLMLAHIVFMTVGWFFILPVGVVLNVTRSRLAVVTQLSFLLLNAIGLLLGMIYTSKSPDLYPKNSHHRLGWMLVWTVLAQTIMVMTRSSGSFTRNRHTFTPISVEAMAHHHQDNAGFSHSNGDHDDHMSSRNNSMSGTTDCGEDLSHRMEEYQNGELEPDIAEKRTLLGKAAATRLGSWLSPVFLRRVRSCMEIAQGVIDYTILPLGFIAFATGAVVYGGVFHGRNVLNGLAHFIKGGIFFWYGLLTLGRWMGCFADIGWAWNLKPPAGIVSSRKARVPSAEFVESFVIFLYGSTNVFLEHLTAWGGRWTAQDLEHVSISIMFFGGGLCGMLVESRRVRDLLNTSVLASSANRGKGASSQRWAEPKPYVTSMNPFPGLIILLLGLMMSSHHQASMVSTTVHKQWGTLFVGFALARGVTYILMYLKPPSSYLPSRPPSEIITSFCLISGGLIFMASNKDTVGAMERHDLNAMFVFTATMGFTAFLMAWTILVLTIRGWAASRNRPNHLTRQPSSV